MTRESLLGGVLLLIVVGLIGFLVLKPGGSDNTNKLQQLQQAQNADRRSILRPQLLPFVEQKQQGALITASGQGMLGQGDSWQYKNAWPNPDLKVQTSDGKVISIPVSGLGEGGVLKISAAKKLDYLSATTLARKALNDPKLTLAGGRLFSKNLVARKVKLSDNKLTVEGLFSAKACKGKYRDEPGLIESCQTRTGKKKK